MKIQIVKKLTQLNDDFYSLISNDFHESRNHFWPGWYELIPYIKDVIRNNHESKILDLGCGTARFALFLQENFPDLKWKYTGLDFNQNLLNIAKQQINQLEHCQVKNSDLNSQINEIYNLVVCFGVTHHIPDQKNRNNFLTKISKNLSRNGIVCVSFWQFMNEPERYQKKIIAPKQVSISESDLELNDFILDWQRGKKAFRYCHHWSHDEIYESVKKSKMKIIQEYCEDSKSGRANRYLILQKV